jgi:GR25 family glycosyltransferase involved in LPS biosynthesis
MDEEYGNIPDGFFLSQSEIDELRKSKRELTEYGKEKIRKLIYERDMKKMEDATENLVLNNLTHEEMLEIAAEREAADQQPFYQFFVVDYYGSGEGRTLFLQISRKSSPQYPEDYFTKRWEKFVDDDFYLQGTEELTEEKFMKRYSPLISERIINLMNEKTLGIWQTHFHFNRS